MTELILEVKGTAGLITLNRPRTLNVLSLGMIRDMTAALLAWRSDDSIEFVAVRGMGKDGPFGHFCAGGDIRFFHEAARAGDARLEDFFTEEYALNWVVHTFPKPYAVFMDGVVMGGGMGISGHAREAATMRIATERTKMAMPETNIGLFPDVAGGYFLSRCPGHIGEFLALTGVTIGGADAIYAGLADAVVPSSGLQQLWDSISGGAPVAPGGGKPMKESMLAQHEDEIEQYFALGGVTQIVHALEAAPTEFARHAGMLMRKRSPLMLHVTLEQLRRARSMSFADELRMERNMMRHCFHFRPGASETVEGIRALAVDKDHAPRWNPARIEDVAPEMVQAFFEPPWPNYAHPLRDLT